MPEITVIMGVHNGGPYLAEAVASVRNQTFVDWELVIVENGSTDGAIDALEAADSDSRIRILRSPTALGPGGALAVACAAAQGRYLAVLDHDDRARPKRLEVQRAFLEAQPEILLAGSAVELIDQYGWALGREPFFGFHEDIYAMTQFVHTLRHSAVMFRRELLSRVQYRAELGAASDFDFFARAAEVGRLAALPAVLCEYRLHPDSVTVRSAANAAVSGALARMLTRRRRLEKPEDFATWVERFTRLLGNGTSEAQTNLACARIFRAEGHFDLAALHAWLAWRAGGGWSAAACYMAAAWRGLGRHPGGFSAVAKACLKEPVHHLLRAGGMPDRPQF